MLIVSQYRAWDMAKGPIPRADKSRRREGQNGRRQKKLISMTDLIGRATNFVWSFNGNEVIAILVADQLNFFNVFYKTGRQPERHLLPFVSVYLAPRPSDNFFLVSGRISLNGGIVKGRFHEATNLLNKHQQPNTFVRWDEPTSTQRPV